MRLPVLLLALAAAAAVPAAEVGIVRVFTGWRDAASFKRISEYFTGREDTGREIVLRTQPGERGGYYFLVRTQNPAAATDAVFVLQVVTPDSSRPRVFRFPAALPAGPAVYQLGVTGKDWPDREVDAMAWRIVLTAGDGRALAEAKSYLWEKPAGE